MDNHDHAWGAATSDPDEIRRIADHLDVKPRIVIIKETNAAAGHSGVRS